MKKSKWLVYAGLIFSIFSILQSEASDHNSLEEIENTFNKRVRSLDNNTDGNASQMMNY